MFTIDERNVSIINVHDDIENKTIQEVQIVSFIPEEDDTSLFSYRLGEFIHQFKNVTDKDKLEQKITTEFESFNFLNEKDTLDVLDKIITSDNLDFDTSTAKDILTMTRIQLLLTA